VPCFLLLQTRIQVIFCDLDMEKDVSKMFKEVTQKEQLVLLFLHDDMGGNISTKTYTLITTGVWYRFSLQFIVWGGRL
jgi:hypothetical protein